MEDSPSLQRMMLGKPFPASGSKPMSKTHWFKNRTSAWQKVSMMIVLLLWRWDMWNGIRSFQLIFLIGDQGMSSLLVQAKGNFQNTRRMGSQHLWAYLPRPLFLDMLLLCATRHIEGYLRHFYPAINLAEAFHSWNCKGRSHLYNVPELCAGKLGWFCIVLPTFRYGRYFWYFGGRPYFNDLQFPDLAIFTMELPNCGKAAANWKRPLNAIRWGDKEPCMGCTHLK